MGQCCTPALFMCDWITAIWQTFNSSISLLWSLSAAFSAYVIMHFLIYMNQNPPKKIMYICMADTKVNHLYSCRTLGKTRAFSIQRICFLQLTTCLLLVRTRRRQHYAGVFCWWPNILKFKVLAIHLWADIPISLFFTISRHVLTIHNLEFSNAL